MRNKSELQSRPAVERRRLQHLARSRWMPCTAARDSEILREIRGFLEAAACSGLRHFSAMDRTVALPHSKRLGKKLEQEERHLPEFSETMLQDAAPEQGVDQ